jgi:ATP-dependent Zn protease
MLVNCVNKIKEDQIHYLITPENVDFYNLNNQSIINLIKINGNDINTIELNEEENKFYQEINQIYGESEIDKNIKEEKSFFEKYFYYIICIVLFIVLIFFNSFFKATKKNEDKENQNLNKDKQKKE